MTCPRGQSVPSATASISSRSRRSVGQRLGSVPAAVDALITALPKTELHVHLEGSLPPALLFELARKHQVSGVPESPEDAQDWYAFRDFPHFIDVYRTGLDVLRDDRLARETIANLAEQNVRYAEINFSLHDHLRRGLSPELVFAGLEAGRADAEHDHNITVRWVPDFPGEAGPEAGELTPDAVLAHGPSSVLSGSASAVSSLIDVASIAAANGHPGMSTTVANSGG